MKANTFSIAAFVLATGGIFVCWLFTMALGHHDNGRLPFISETGTHAPERYIFTFTLSSAAVLFAISGYLLFRYLKDLFQDVADFFFGFERGGSSGGGSNGDDDGRYNRDRIIIYGSERMMLSLLPKANYVALVLSELACACLLFLAVVDLKEARYYHGTASAMFFVLGIMQGLFLTTLLYCLRRVQTLHTRQSNLRFYAKLGTLFLCLFCTFPLALVEGLFIGLAGLKLGDDALHNVGTVNQYLLTTALVLHFFCYSSELSNVDVKMHLHFDAVDRIITLGGRGSSLSGVGGTSFLERASLSDDEGSAGKRFSIDGSEDEGEELDEEEQGIRFVNKGSSAREMHEIIPTEVLDLHS